MIELIIILLILAVSFGMRGRGFSRRLRRELPRWVEAGLVAPEKAPGILAHVAAESQRHSLASMFAVLGAVLLGVGVITFFAANWQEMPKIVKLLLLFGGMWAAFATAAWSLGRASRGWLSESMLLLGVLMFGANIMLIAQIYHIEAHYPDGVLVWSLGALLVSWLLASPAAFVAGLMLAMLWSGMEAIDFSRLHWPFLIVLAGFSVLAVRQNWLRFAHLLMVALLLWSMSTYVHFIGELRDAGAVVYLTQIFFLFYLALFIGGLHLDLSEYFAGWAATIRQYAVVAGLAALWVLTFPDILTSKIFVAGNGDMRPAADVGWIGPTVLMLALVAALAVWHRQRTLSLGLREVWHVWGDGILGLMLACLLVNLFVPGSHGSMMAIAFNAVFFAATLWLVYAGAHLDSRNLVNLGFMFFAAGILARYFDFFWKLLDRSFFFMAGGILLIIVAGILDRKRRQLMADMKEGEL
ncbi:MAG TPA: DUF2157 domain-containing protein [Mariprofundaceae bacterium]|nr:DUF2157 domain-containing protein [Mariprofundaceae bacterium]